MIAMEQTEQVLTHQAVMLKESLEALQVKPDGYYIDGTLGRGGHSQAILNQLNDDGRLLVFDKDPEAISWAKDYWQNENRVRIWHGSFKQMDWVAQQFGMARQVDGILLDLGVASPQLDQAQRGFSFNHDGPLDMRMNPHQGRSAAQWLVDISQKELADVLHTYGEERYARRIAKAIKSYQQHTAITTTKQLADLIKQTVPKIDKFKHPATRSFQAIRIVVNEELDDLQKGLEAGVRCLAQGGRFAVISFHSLEDRLVKRFFKTGYWPDQTPPDLPIRQPSTSPRLKAVSKPVKASREQAQINTRARSATLRVAEKTNQKEA